MTDLVAPSAGIRRYGDHHVAMATQVVTAATAPQGPSIAAAAPVLGVIGEDFLAAYAQAQANYMASAHKLGHVYATTATTSYESAKTYTTTDDGSAAAFTPNGPVA